MERRGRDRLRCPLHDYRRPGAWFVTIRATLGTAPFGRCIRGQMRRSPVGDLVDWAWREVPEHFAAAVLDEWVVMPDHFHAILWIDSTRTMPGLVPRLGHVIRSFKAATTRQARLARLLGPAPLWQSVYHDRRVRDREALQAIRRYIRDNPRNWRQGR